MCTVRLFIRGAAAITAITILVCLAFVEPRIIILYIAIVIIIGCLWVMIKNIKKEL